MARQTVTEKLLTVGIRLPSYASGSRKVTCPQCSHTRKHKSDPCLSVTIDDDAENAVWMCHNCDWRGRTVDLPDPSHGRRRRSYRRPQEGEIKRPTVEVIRWFADRGIPAEVVQRNRIGFVRQLYMPQLEARVACIVFPYYRQRELVNVKYRALARKAFAQVKDAESILFGLDDIAETGDGKAIIVEGECDKLALEVAGYRNVISVPEGAPAKLRDEPKEDDPKFAYLANCADELDRIKGGFILAVDNDAAGKVLEEELARRFGKERCWRVRWPDGNDLSCKDANEVLMRHGPEVLRECIEAAEPYPISGLYSASEYFEDVWALYEQGRERGARTGFAELDQYMTIARGQLSVVTGIPNHGKSEFIDQLTVNLAQLQEWRIALCSFENSPEDHEIKIAEKHASAPFWDGPRRRMTPAELTAALAWIDRHYWFIRTEIDAPPTIDWILERARGAVMRHGISGLVIDPYNEIEHRRPPNMSETEYVSEMLGKVRRFAVNHDVHVWFVAHPVKMQPQNGKMPVPTLYDISGSANWTNKADVGLVVHRNFETNQAEIHVQKVRDKWVGQPGRVTLDYDKSTGRYSEDNRAQRASGYRDD
jgi:twinkle protein